MKKYFLFISLFLFTLSSGAQSFYKGASVATVGYGVPNLLTLSFRVIYNITEHTNYSFSAIGPITFRYEYGVTDRLGIGLAAGYSSANVGYNFEDWNANHTQKVNYTARITWKSPSAGLRLTYHFANKDKFDPYFGLTAGFTGNTLTYSDDSPFPDTYKSPGFGSFYFSAGIGFRRYFTNNIGFYMELGWDKFALLQGGLAVKF